MKNDLFTSESVTAGHPDKLCDMISDGLLDKYLEQDLNSRCAIECFAVGNLLVIGGEVKSNGIVDIESSAREIIRKIGYTNPDLGFSDQCEIDVKIQPQSHELNENADGLKAGDQGIMFGYACEGPDLMPLPIWFAHRLTKHLTELRISKFDWLRPDGKSQVTMRYPDNKIDNIVIAAHHSPSIELPELRDLLKVSIKEIIPSEYIDNSTNYYINQYSTFHDGGPGTDTGLTGRKIIVDTYGGWARHGGGAFSGKDATKVDRSGAYMARYISKCVVHSGLAKECELQLGFVLGQTKPVSIRVFTNGTGNEREIEEIINNSFDLTVEGIIKYLKLTQPIYSKTASYGHFGFNTAELPWEQVRDIA